jgi:phenylacetate-CoA ligase
LTGLVSKWERTGFPLTELKHIKNIGDTVHVSLRERVKALTGCEIEDNYSSSEVGGIAIECPESGLFHVMEENLIVEVLDDAGNDCKPGEIGRVVITDLFNSAAPIIRYDIGDYAEVADACTCGRHLMTLKRVLGRERNLLKRADGSTFWPLAAQRKVAKIVEMTQWQIIQHAIDRIEYRMVTAEPLTPDQESELNAMLGESLGFPGQVTVTRFAKELPLFNGKYEESICLVE